MGHGEDGDLPELAVHQAGDPRVRVHIHRRGRLVQNQQLRVSLKRDLLKYLLILKFLLLHKFLLDTLSELKYKIRRNEELQNCALVNSMSGHQQTACVVVSSKMDS